MRPYLGRVGLLRLLLVEGLRTPGHGVPAGCRRAILRGAHELDPTTLDDDIGGWWKILCVTDRVAVAQKARLLPVQGMNLPATEGKSLLDNTDSRCPSVPSRVEGGFTIVARSRSNPPLSSLSNAECQRNVK